VARLDTVIDNQAIVIGNQTTMIDGMNRIIANQEALAQQLTVVTGNQQLQLQKEDEKIVLIQGLIAVQEGISGKLDTVISGQTSGV
jgi:hypothetical protein